MNDWSLNEKSLLATLIAYAFTASYYFGGVRVLLASGERTTADVAGLAISALVVLVIVEAVYHAIIARPGERMNDDERDRTIRALGASTEATILATGVIATIGHIAIGSLFAPANTDLFLIGNMLMAVLLLAEAAGNSRQLWHYRRGL